MLDGQLSEHNFVENRGFSPPCYFISSVGHVERYASLMSLGDVNAIGISNQCNRKMWVGINQN